MLQLGIRPKLLLTMVGSILLLTTFIILMTVTGLFRARDLARNSAIEGLEDQAQSSIQLLIERNATLTRERLAMAASAGFTAGRAILAAEEQQIISQALAETIPLVRRADGAMVDPRPGRITSVYVPRSAPIRAAVDDMRRSAILDTILPQQLLTVRNVMAVAYVGPSGLVRFYPSLDEESYAFEFEQGLLQRFKDGERQQIWLPPFNSLQTFIATDGDLATGVVTPLYRGDEFRGVVIVYLSIELLTIDLTTMRPTDNAYAFMIDSERRLIGAPGRALPQLTGRPSVSGNETIVLTRTASPEFDQAIARMAQGEDGVERVQVEGREYLLSYMPVAGPGWSLGLMTPIDEITSQATEISNIIEETSFESLGLTLLGISIFVVLMIGVSLYISSRLSRPLVRLARAAEAIGRGEYDQQVAISSGDELGQVAAAFNTMSQSVLRARQQLQEQNRQLEEVVQSRTAALQSTVAQLEESLSRQETLYELLRAVSTPVIPLAEGVLLLPLIGTLDEQRAQQALQLLLRSIETQRARTVILDVTGLPVIDTAVAGTLLRAAQAARLLGAETILAGIRPEVAETLVVLGVGLDELHPAGDLQAALIQALRLRQRGDEVKTARMYAEQSPSSG